MVIHFGTQLDNTVGNLRQGSFVAFGQLLHALGELLAHAVHLSVDGGIQCREPFAVHHQSLYFILGQFRVVGVSIRIELGFGFFDLLL